MRVFFQLFTVSFDKKDGLQLSLTLRFYDVFAAHIDEPSEQSTFCSGGILDAITELLLALTGPISLDMR